MPLPLTPDAELEKRIADRLLDVLIRAALIFAMAMLCFRIFSPFLSLMVWALILAVTLYPLQRLVAARLGGRQGLAATLIVTLGIVLIVGPTSVLMNSLGDSMHEALGRLQESNVEIPAPSPAVAEWPLVGKNVYATWSKAHADLPALLQKLQPQIADLARKGLGVVAGIGTGLLKFLASFVIAGIIMAFGESGSRASRAIFERIAGAARGGEFAVLATATIRAVAQGVIGVAFIQAIIVGISLLVAGVPWTGVLALVVLMLGIAQVPAVIVTLPAIAYIWVSGDYANAAAIGYTVLLFVSGMSDNVLKPLMLGRGVDAPMPVVLIGALGGMVAAGILGMFVGATVLALGYQMFMGWVDANPDSREVPPAQKPEASG